MKNKMLDIFDPREVRLDKSGLTEAYFCLSEPVLISSKTIDDLKRIAIQGKKDLRICLHESSVDMFHNMIIVQHLSDFYPPHKHPIKPECYHIIEGELGVIHFDDAGNIIKTCLLDAKNNFIYRVRSNEYHVILPLSELVVYHESKPGPFLRKEDLVEPGWMPNKDDEQAVKRYNKSIFEVFNS